jgi:lysophospholipase L1-like esterase
VLHIGDSFAGALGVPLGKRLEAHGVHSILKHIDASYLTTWAWQEDVSRMVWKYNPDLVMITLGANELAIVEPEQRARAIHKIVESLGGRPCVWVAIPLWKGPENGLLDVIRRESLPCRYLDTNALMDTVHMSRISDGIHPTSSAREAWADVVMDWLGRERAPAPDQPWHLRPDPGS